MIQYLPIIQIILSIILIVSVLLQQRGSSLGGSFGGDSATYTSRRGMEKVFFAVTIIAGVLFFTSAVVSLFV